MRKPLILSALFHALVLVFLLVSFNVFSPPKDSESAIIVAITPDMEIAPEAVSKPAQPKPPAPPEPEDKPQAEKAPEKQEEQKNPEKQRVDDEAPEAPPAPAEPKPSDQPPPPKPPERVTKDLPNVSPREKPKPPSKFDPTKIAQLLDKRDNLSPPTKDKQVKKVTDPDPSKSAQQTPTPQVSQQAKANIASLIASQIRENWNAPVGNTGAETLVVKIRIYLRADGSLAQRPEIYDQGRMSDPIYRAAAEAAVRAVQKAAPLQRLPPEYYDFYKDLILNFDPKLL